MEKKQKYEEFLPQLQALIEGEHDEEAVLANASAALHTKFKWWWTGFYRVVGDELLLGPFQGPVACYHIPFGKGVCGSAWKERRTIVVPNVELFPNHIACSSLSRSEIVVPITDACGDIRGVLDIDSTKLAAFNDTDRQYLERAAALIAKAIYHSE